MSASTHERALDLLSLLVIDDEGTRWGSVAHPFQWEDARAVLDPDSPTPYHFLTRPRGASKTADLAGMALAAMLLQLPTDSRLYGLAADRDQGRLMVDSAASYVRRTPELRGAFDVRQFTVSATRSGSTLEVLAADAPGAWGLRPAFLIVDELAQWSSTPSARTLWEATTSSLSKVPGSRLAVLTSAGDPAHWSRKVLEHAEADPLWRVRQVPGPSPWADPARIDEQRRRLTASQFARLFLNQWTAAEDRLVDAEDLRACVTLRGPQQPLRNTRYVIGVDLGLKRDRTVATVCHAAPGSDAGSGPRVVLDRLEVWQGSRRDPLRLADVEAWVQQAAVTYAPAQVVCDPWQAVGMAQRLRERGIRVEEFAFTAQSVGRLASTLHLLLRDRALDLPDDAELLEELSNVRLRETAPGVLRLDHDAGRHDDRAVALALAATRLLSAPERPVRRGRLVPTGGRSARGSYEVVFEEDDPEVRLLAYRRRAYEADRSPHDPTWSEHVRRQAPTRARGR